MQKFRISVLKRSKKKSFHSFQAEVSRNHITIKGLVKQSRSHQVEWKARSESKFWIGAHFNLEQSEVNARNPARGCRRGSVLRCYPTYLDDSFEEEESPVDDFSRPKSEKMTKHVLKILSTMKILDNECFSIQ